MKTEELRQLSPDELSLRLEDSLEEMENLRFQHSTHQLDNPMLIKYKRKEIARIRTLIREYQAAEAK